MAEKSSTFTKIGGGLVEIAALTALIGSATAESLTLGNKGAPGLAWAASSTFGALSVIKACVAGATPGWLRDSLGVRNTATDLAIGLSFDLDSRYKDREDMARKNLGDPIGVMCGGCHTDTQQSTAGDTITTQRDVYAFDQFTMDPVHNVSPSLPGDPLQVHIFVQDPWYDGPVMTQDWIGLMISVLKISETYTLWRYGARRLCWISSSSWLYFFTVSIVLLQRRISRGYGKNFDNGRSDILTGQLPAARKKGGERVVLLGVPRNFRHHILWRISWTIGSMVSAASLITTYIFLSQADVTVTYIWVAFQILWLVLRSIYFHVAQGTNAIVCPILEQRPFDKLLEGHKRRTLDLIFAMSRSQMHGHPRGVYSYTEDLASLEDFKKAFMRDQQRLDKFYPIELLQVVGGLPHVTFTSIIGDTLLSSTAWAYGSNLSGMDLYDSCVVTFKIDEHQWIQAMSEDMKILGKRQVRLLNDVDVTTELKSGELNISMYERVDCLA
ncbi:hypothetical protein IFR04_014918 [Cadophora malorum]|uniref:Uncharacterized protein n=1 Tax=Cadophora malorum TaxID=108018 RepID=A0A8H7W5U8_9HELO|nr:hypothetical protein IFR04_014918 [Cadophora malorum]